jgi:hypothetical protein
MVATGKIAAVGVAAAALLAACGSERAGGGARDDAPAAEGRPCAEVAVAMQAEVERARALLGGQAPNVVAGFQDLIAAQRKRGRKAAEAAYDELKRRIANLGEDANALLEDWDALDTSCEPEADTEPCWGKAAAAYEAAAAAAVGAIQGPLQDAFRRFEAFFKLGERAKDAEVKRAYTRLSAALDQLRAQVVAFAEAQREAAGRFNSCAA